MASIRDVDQYQLQQPELQLERGIGIGSSSSSSSSSLVSQHAIARGTSLLGIYNSGNDHMSSTSTSTPTPTPMKFKWKTDLESLICHVTSTMDGSILAASTIDGSISIIRGCDGRVVTKKQIKNNNNNDGNDGNDDGDNEISDGEGEGDHARVAFIRNGGGHGDNNSNSNSNSNISSNQTHTLAIYQLGEDASMDVILVSGMDGGGSLDGLNSSSMEKVDEATSKFTIDGVKFVDTTTTTKDNDKNGNSHSHNRVNVRSRAGVNILRAMRMRTRDENGTEVETIRFLLGGIISTSTSTNQDPNGDRGNTHTNNTNAIIAVHDYNLHTKATVIVQDRLNFGDDSSAQEWEVDGNANANANANANSISNGSVQLDCNEYGDFIVVAAQKKINTTSTPLGMGMTASADTATATAKICWLEMKTLQMVSQYEIKRQVQVVGTCTDMQVMSLCPLKSCASTGTSTGIGIGIGVPSLAAVVALKSKMNNKSELLVVHGAIRTAKDNDDDNMKIDTDMDTDASIPCAIGGVHIVYTIPIAQPMDTIDLNRVHNYSTSTNTDSNGPAYAFWYKIRQGAQVQIQEFQPEPHNVIGRVRLLLSRGLIDKAAQFIASINSTDGDDDGNNNGNGSLGTGEIISCPYGSIHASELTLGKWRQLISNANYTNSASNSKTSHKMLSSQTKDQVKECLDRLTYGAKFGGKAGVQTLLAASHSLRIWSSHGGIDTNAMSSSDGSSDGNSSPYLRDFRLILVAMSMSISKAIKGASSQYAIPLTEEMNILNAKTSALKSIELILEEEKNKVKLTSPLLDVNSHVELYQCLISHSMFKVAECVRLSEHAGGKITADDMVETVVTISSKVDPRTYCAWLETSIFPEINLNRRVLDCLIDWCCQIADDFDCKGGHGIEASIRLLETFERSMAKNAQESHSSFAFFSPFVTSNPRDGNVPIIIDTNDSNSSSKEGRPGATAKNDDNSDPQRKLHIKLMHSRIIQSARELGLSRKVINLQNFQKDGGAEVIARELVQLYFSQSKADSTHLSERTEDIQAFCQLSNVSLDHAVAQYADELCSRNEVDGRILTMAEDLVQLCTDPGVKCEITLKFLQAALLSPSKPDCLKKLAKEAVLWASNNEIRSEVEEATRLLGIDEIVRRYCGNKAAEIFRVSDSLHSMRLLNYVSRNIDSASIISDVLFLCSAFTHLSAVDHCVTLMERVIIAKTSSAGSRAKQCSTILERIHDADKRLAGTIAARVCVYCAEIMEECAFNEKLREKEKKKGELHLAACSAATALCYTMTNIEKESFGEIIINSHQSILFPMPQSSSWSSVRNEFQRIQSLFTEFGVCISLSQLRNRCHHDFFTKSLIIDALNQTNSEIESIEADLKMKLTKARRGCTLLYGENLLITTSNWCRAIGSIACKLVNSKREDKAMILLEASGLIDEISNDSAYQAIAMVSISLCSRASDDSSSYANMNDKTSERAMRCIILAASLLQEHALVFCPTTLLPLMVFLSNLVDVANQIILRADCGVGEDMDAYKQSLHEKTIMRQQPLLQSQERKISDIGLQKVTPNLHPTWHVGDGLLLSPFEALSRCMSYCRGLLSPDNTQNNYGQHEVHNFLATRGAHSISLRMLMCASVVTSCKELPCENSMLHDIAQDIIFSMAERSLGGSGTGYTNARIDSHLAVSTILYLPIKVAFKAYERCLPSAMSGRDFERVIALANIGQRAAGATCEFDETLSATNCWKKQTNLLSQCKRLALKAYWWRVLKYFDVSFDPSAFDNADKKESEKNILLLISDLIVNSSRIIRSATTVQMLAADFAKAFELKSDLPVQKHIEFLLTWPETCHAKDLRHSLKSCEMAVKHLLGQLNSGLVRSSVLRRCLVAAEEKDNSGKDFERYSMLLSMYHRELHGIHSMKSKESSVHKYALEQEIERIDRRQDALAILSAYFRERKLDERPLFQRCFQPLPSDLKPNDTNAGGNFVGVLGIIAEDQKDLFDPLLPLVPYLKKDPSRATSALAPMCISLGLPSGFIHARALVHRILIAKALNGSLPPFESEVHPTIKKLRIANDGTELAEWCSSQYDEDSTQRFLCLEVALNLAIKASTFAEQALRTHRNFQNRTKMKEDEKNCLERVERLTLAKSSLSDVITVKRMIKDEIGADNLPIISTLLFKVVEKARFQNCSKNRMEGLTPEKLVEKLLVEGSLLTAELSLDPSVPFDRADFRRVSYIIHKASSTLEDQYSHIKIGYICRRLVRRWLLHGDETHGSEIEENSSKIFVDTKNKRTSDTSQIDHSIDEDDTANLVLDLKTITSGNAAWMDDIGCDEPKKKKLKTIIAEEEKSSLKANTRRESSEYLSARVGLRVAMVMFFAQDFHSEGEGDDHPNEENLKPLDQTLPNQTTDMHARYLIKLVFAKTGLHSFKSEISSADSGSGRDGRSGLVNVSTNTRRVVRSEGKALTFAMRHRALRAASVLCPEGVLNTLIVEENFFGQEKCSLAKCCFGSFLAKEIEEMGLPLPHSDLVQLSVMHHPSYARTLWRHHGRSGPDNLRGRLMLLMLELALRQKKIMDSSLVSSILNEILSLNVPRTNLLICECIARTDDIKDVFDIVGAEISQITKRLVSSIFQEVTSLNSDVKQCVNTLQRLGKIIVSFMKSGSYNNEVELLINSMYLSAQQCDKQIRGCLFEVAVAISCEVNDTTMKSILLKKSYNMAENEDSLQDRLATLLGNKPNNILGQSGFGGWDCFFKLMQKETGLADSFVIVGGL